MSMVVRLDQVWEVYSVRARAWIRATVTGLSTDSATLGYESFPGSITVDLWVMRFEPTRFRRANSYTGDLVENERKCCEINVKRSPACQRHLIAPQTFGCASIF
jgi:hypothetical protein